MIDARTRRQRATSRPREADLAVCRRREGRVVEILGHVEARREKRQALIALRLRRPSCLTAAFKDQTRVRRIGPVGAVQGILCAAPRQLHPVPVDVVVAVADDGRPLGERETG